MENYFELLDIEQTVHIHLETLSAKYKQLAAAYHPDNTQSHGNNTKYRMINTAYETLKSPSRRIAHLMELNGMPYKRQGTVSDHLMDLFMSTAQLLQEVDAFLKKKSTASSALTKALLEGESQQFQENISAQIDIIEKESFNILANVTLVEQLNNTARDLAFLEKWQAQLKERYASLF